MAKNVPTTMVLPKLGEAQPGKPVLKATWQTLIEAQHYVYGRQGNHVLNAVFDPPWTSLAYASGGSAYHSVGAGSTGGIELNQHSAIFQFQRLMYSTVHTDQGYAIEMHTYAQNLDVKVSGVRLNTKDGNSSTSGTQFTLTTTHGADSEWQSGTQELTKAEVSRGGTYTDESDLAYFYVYIEAKVPASGTGYLHQIALREQLITAGTNIPRGA